MLEFRVSYYNDEHRCGLAAAIGPGTYGRA